MKKENYYLFASYSIILIFINYIIYKGLLSNYVYRSANFSDLQWSPSVLFFQGIDVYGAFYSDSLKQLINLSGFPNYSTGSIYLHLPLAKINFEQAKIFWLILFSLLMMLNYLILKNYSKIKEIKIFFVFLILIISKPYIWLLSTGQFSIISISSFIIYFFYIKRTRLIALYLISIKYSFAPFVFFYSLFINKEKNYTILIVLISIFFVFHYSYYFDSNFFNNLIAPIYIGKLTSASGVSDLQTLLGNHPKNDFVRYFILLILSLLTFIFFYKITKRDLTFDISICSLLTLMFFKHLYYDYVLLMPLIFFCLDKKKIVLRAVVIFIVLYFWFFYINSFTIVHLYSKVFIILNFLLLLLALITLVLFNLNSKGKILLKKFKNIHH